MPPSDAGALGVGAAPTAPPSRLAPPLRWLAGCFLAERERWPLWLPVLFGAGVGLYFALTVEPPLWLGLAAATLTLAIAIVAARRQRWAAPGIAVAALALGFAAAEIETWWVAAPVLKGPLKAVTVEGRLVRIEPLPEALRLVIAPSHIAGVDAGELPALVRINLHDHTTDLVPGEWLRIARAQLYPPGGPAMPGAYDFQRAAYFAGLGAIGATWSAPRRIEAPPGAAPAGWRVAVEGARQAVAQRIHAALPGEEGAIAAPLVTGETHALPPDEAGAFRDAGLAHILVIAGLHMGMVGAAAFFLLRALFALIAPLALRYPTKKWAAAGALLVIFCYLLLSGATVPSRRAFIMIGLVLMAVLVDRLSFSPRAIAYAALLVLALAPDVGAGASFQMSFAAVAGLIAFYEAMRRRLSQWHSHAGLARRVGLYVLGIAFTTVITTLATMPFTVYHFNRLPLYSVAANVLAVPITGFWIMPWALLACLLMPLGLERLALVPMGWGIDAVAAIAKGVTAWPGAVLNVPSMPAASLALVALGGLWLCIWTRAWRWLGLAPIAAGYLTLLFVRPPDVLVSAEDGLVAVRAADGSYLLSAKPRSSFVEETWTRRAAAAAGALWPSLGDTADGRLSCDARRCLYRARERRVVLVRSGLALAEGCAAADLVVSPVPAQAACGAMRAIDPDAVRRNGAHAVWLDPGGVTIETVADWRGTRAWAPRHLDER
jgi:competence protein ComEC